jgi:hypothetical protein
MRALRENKKDAYKSLEAKLNKVLLALSYRELNCGLELAGSGQCIIVDFC